MWDQAAAAQLASMEFGPRDDERRALRESADRLSQATPHTLRHTFLALLDRAGVSRKSQMKYAGHSQSRTTERYVHASLESLNRIVEMLEQIAGEWDQLLRTGCGSGSPGSSFVAST